MNEEWIDINKTYSISSFGRVYNKNKKQLLNICDNGHGYKYVSIKIDNKTGKQYVHRLVAKHFIDNPENKKEVNHIDGDKSNNKLSNLEWVTRSENELHAHRIGLKHCTLDIKYRKVVLLENEEIFNSILEASEKYNIKPQHIWRCCNNVRKTTNNQHWVYYETYEELKNNNEIKNYISTNKIGRNRKVKCIEKDIIFDSISDATRWLGINHSHISDACNGKRNKAHGFKWEYVD